jgi:hypothetical protein
MVMRILVQVFCVLAISVGAGMLGFSNKLGATIGEFYRGPDAAIIAPMAHGFGVGLLCFGTLGMIMFWLNKIGSVNTIELGDNSARTLSMIAIWLSITTILTFGVFGIEFQDSTGLGAMLLMVAFICTAATITSAIVFGWKPWIRNNQSMADSGRPSTS